ncbi:MAG: ankyrin repeat domain-containing protein [Candidatus Omnitrophica bacterium]|nr:ankyrin repeat domain-containing protein [Candidatus Omnitrophota bacterium]
MMTDKGADTLVDGDLLLLAARKGYLSTLRELIQEGLNLNVRDDTGRTPLIHAAEKGHLEIVRELCQAGADLWALTTRGMTAEILASTDEVREALRQAMAERSNQT